MRDGKKIDCFFNKGKYKPWKEKNKMECEREREEVRKWGREGK